MNLHTNATALYIVQQDWIISTVDKKYTYKKASIVPIALNYYVDKGSKNQFSK